MSAEGPGSNYPPDPPPGFPSSSPPFGTPAAPPPEDPVARSRSRLGLLAVGVSLLALVIAVGSAVFAWRAIDQAKDAKAIVLAGGDRGSGTGPEPTATAVVLPEPPPPSGPAGDPTSAPGGPQGTVPPTLGEFTVYEGKYNEQDLTLRFDSNYGNAVDLDEPRVAVDDGTAEFDYRTSSGSTFAQPILEFEDGVEVSEATNPAVPPKECAERIRTARLVPPRIPVRKGLVLCVQTSFAKAQERGEPWRMVRLEVTDVAEDKTTTIRVTAWNIPR